MTLESPTCNEELQEPNRDLKTIATGLDHANSSTVMIDRLYKLKATATEAIELLKDEETSAVDKPVNW